MAILFALTLPVIIGAAGFGVETTYWYFKRLSLQSAADSASYAAALEKRAGGNETEILAVAKQTVQGNGFDPAVTGVAINAGTVSGGGTIEVVLSDTAQRFFTKMFVANDPQLVARATSTYNTAASACILALSPTMSKAANFSGSANVTLNGCSVMSNSSAPDAINVWGSAQLYTNCAISVGQATYTSGLHLTECASPIEDAPSVADPYGDVPEPTASGSCLNQNANNTTISAGRYCNGLDLKNNVTLNPGVYYIESGNFDINSNANISGTGVTIYLAPGVNLSMNGNATVNLTAPTTGATKGILFFGNRTDNNRLNKFNGTASSKLTGAIYFPTQQIQYNGNFSGLNGCTHVIGNTVEWTGNSTVAVNCSAYGMRTLPALTLVKLTA